MDPLTVTDIALPTGIGGLVLSLLWWIRARLGSGEIVIRARSAGDLMAATEAMRAERDAAIVDRDRALACAKCAEERADQYQERLISRLEALTGGTCGPTNTP